MAFGGGGGFGFTGPTLIPGTLTGANNGLSNSTINPAFVVLGQDAGQVGNPAALLSSRQIPMGLFNLFLDGPNAGIAISQNDELITGDTGAGFSGAFRLQDAGQANHEANFVMDGSQAVCFLGYANGVPNGSFFRISATQINVTNIALGGPVTTAKFEVTTGGIATLQPSANGPGVWNLGKLVAGAVVPDATQYIEVLIDGVIKKLIIAV